MNKVSLIIIFGFAIVACKERTFFQTASKARMRGQFKIDPSVTEVVRKKMNELTKDTGRFFSAVYVREFEDGLKSLELTPKDYSWEGYQSPASFFGYAHDSLDLFVIHSLGTFHIQKFKDYCWVTHFSNPYEDPKRFYKTTDDDWIYKERLEVPCRFTVLLDHEAHQKDEVIYGYIQAKSDEYSIRTQTGYKKGRIEFETYFKAMKVFGD